MPQNKSLDRKAHLGFFRKTQKSRISKRPIASQIVTGGIRLFLDDDRACPKDWVVVRNIWDFEKVLQATPPQSFLSISLDYYLGVAVPDGHEAVKILLKHLQAAPEGYNNLETINCHSSDRDEAAKMARSLYQCLEDLTPLEDVAIIIGHPARLR